MCLICHSPLSIISNCLLSPQCLSFPCYWMSTHSYCLFSLIVCKSHCMLLLVISICLSFPIVCHPIAVVLHSYEPGTPLFQVVNYTWVLHSNHDGGEDNRVCEEQHSRTGSPLATNRFSFPIVYSNCLLTCHCLPIPICHFPLSIISVCPPLFHLIQYNIYPWFTALIHGFKTTVLHLGGSPVAHSY